LDDEQARRPRLPPLDEGSPLRCQHGAHGSRAGRRRDHRVLPAICATTYVDGKAITATARARGFWLYSSPGGGIDLIAVPDGLAAWLNSRDLALDGAVDDAGVQRAVALRETVRAPLSEPREVPREAAIAIERAAIAAQLRLRLTDDGALRLVARAGGVDGALGAILVALYEGSVDGATRRLRVCRNPACRWVFYDHSRNGAARWCSMKVCGARAKAREYRRRRSTDGDRR
jgi:predicted RNA-binding Zn ribbon-like protein